MPITDPLAWLHEPYAHIRIPKALFYSPRYNWMHPESKIIYGALLDRTQLSIARGGSMFQNENGLPYAIYPQTEVMDILHCGHDLATKIIEELVSAGLIRTRRIGCGKPYQIYVQPFDPFPRSKPVTPQSQFKSSDTPTDSQSSPIYPDALYPYGEEEVQIKRSIQFDELVLLYPPALVERIIEVMLYTLWIPESMICFAGKKWDTHTVQEQIRSIDYASAKHILTGLQVQHITEEYTDGYILNAILTILEGLKFQSAGHTVLNDPQKEAVPL